MGHRTFTQGVKKWVLFFVRHDSLGLICLFWLCLFTNYHHCLGYLVISGLPLPLERSQSYEDSLQPQQVGSLRLSHPGSLRDGRHRTPSAPLCLLDPLKAPAPDQLCSKLGPARPSLENLPPSDQGPSPRSSA